MTERRNGGRAEGEPVVSMVRRLAAVAAAVGLFSALPPFRPSASAQALSVPTDTFTLKNGLKVAVHEDHSTPVVAVNVWYHVGSGREVAGRSGFAHLFEHMMFQGSKHVGDGRALQAGAGGGRHAQRHHQHRPHQLLRDGAVATSSSWRSGSRPIAWASCSTR